jgi:hypothetical protein
MPWVGFELTIPVFERAKTFHALDRAAIVIGYAEVSYIEHKQAYLRCGRKHAMLNSHPQSRTSVVVSSG